jgi:hypothetical protein
LTCINSKRFFILKGEGMMIIKGGYYIKARCIENSDIANAPPYVRDIWDYLLRNANHADNKYGGFIVKRGQLFRTYQEIRDALSWKVGFRTERYNENQMKMTMRYLTKQLMIQLTRQPRGVLITICNYDFYQDPKNYDTTNDTTDETTLSQPSSNQLVPSINKKIKNIKNIRNTPEGKTPEKRITGQETEGETKTTLPDWVPKESWDAFVEMRKKLGPITDYAKRLLLVKLKKMVDAGAGTAEEILNQSIENSWKGLFRLQKERGIDDKNFQRQQGRGNATPNKYAGIRTESI